MQTDTATLRLQGKSVHIGTLSVEVVEGVDKGKRADANSELLTVGTQPSNTLVLADRSVSGYHLELTRNAIGIGVVDLGSTNGTFLTEAMIEKATVAPGTVLQLGRSALRITDGAGSTIEVLDETELGELLGRSAVMRRLMAQVHQVARAPVPVLIHGEPGTGKELIAKAIHQASPRANKPFVVVDCAGLSPVLIQSELFGHERGVASGAQRQHLGAFERADEGTLFLDDIGELPSEIQPQLLGALERRRFTRVGGTEEVAVDVRVVCATERDLRRDVNRGTFRSDLFSRIAVVMLHAPSLSERSEDVPLLAERFLRECGHAGPIADVISPELMDSLCSYRWPGNARELRSWVEAGLSMGDAPSNDVDVTDLGSGGPERFRRLPYKDARNAILSEFEVDYLRDLLQQTRGNVSKAARQARMDRSYLIKLLQKHGLK